MSKYHNKNTMYISNVEILVSNLENSLKLYKDILGFQILKQDGNKVYLTANNKDTLVTLVEQSLVVPAQYNLGLYHFALLLPERKHLAKIIESLIKSQYPVTGLSDHLISEAIYLEDPDNNGIEIAVDRDLGDKPLSKVGFVTKLLDYKGVLQELDEDALNILPEDTLMGHIHLHVNNLAEAKEFFQHTLGYDMQLEYKNQASFLSSNNYHHHLAYNVWPGDNAEKRKENQAGLLAYTILVPSHLYNALYNRFKEKSLIINENKNSFTTKDVNDVTLILVKN